MQPQTASEPSDRGGERHSQFSDECLITGKQVRKLVGNCSEMHIWRLLNEKKYQPLGFPKPVKVNGRNYWLFGVMRQWIRKLLALAELGEIPGAGLPRKAVVPRAAQSQATAPCNGDSRKQSRPSKRARRRSSAVR
jgi:predicted DNA-binding transcriptional regulator AlpA